MTKGTKWIIPQSLTTPALRATPPMEGNLVRSHRGPSSPLRRMGPLTFIPSRSKFPSAEGCREAAGWSNPHSPYCGQHTPVTRTPQCPPPHTGPRANKVCVGGVYHPKPRRRVTQVTNNQPGLSPRFYITLP